MSTGGGPGRVLIVGGGIAGLEALIALHDLAGNHAQLTVIAPIPDFTYKPLAVQEPFSLQPAERHELAPVAKEFGARFVEQAVTSVAPSTHAVVLADGASLGYELLVVCAGGRARPAYEHAVTFQADVEALEIDELLARAAAHESKTLAFVVPPGVSWPLPLYELALMTRRRAEAAGSEVRLRLFTPEGAPLIMFGRHASDAVAEVLRARGIGLTTDARITESSEGEFAVIPEDGELEAGAVIALPVIDGPAIEGLPSDDRGFIPIDEHARVRDIEDVYAAGDGTNFPIKQGGLATQQADAAAEHIAARLGASLEPEPFHPVLRGQLITGAETVHLLHDVTGGHGEGTASADYLWWPPHKVSGRYLAPWLARLSPHPELDPPTHPLEVEVALPREWHERPMKIDPYHPPGDG